MSLVGDIIMGCREQMTDLPQGLVPPATASVTETSPVAGPVTFFAGQIVSYQVTQFNPWGESASLAVGTYTVIGSNMALVFAGSCSYTATKIRVYFSVINGAALEQYFELVLNNQGTFVVTVGGTPTGFTAPPLRTSAWNPDTDGTSVSAASMYRWLNDGLETAAQTSDGIRDTTGVPSTISVAQYQLVGQWKRIDNGFYRGYPMIQGKKQQVFRHSPVRGLSGLIAMNTAAERQIFELWTQPDTTAGKGTLTGAITSTDTILNFTPGGSNFELGFGMALLGTYPPTVPSALTGTGSCELVYFSGMGPGTQLLAMTRGLGGTQPQAWPIGTTVQEANIFLTGLRLPARYSVGQANLVLSLPPAWVDAIRVYLLYRFRDAEQDRASAEKLLKEFNAKCEAMRGNREVMARGQIQIGGGGGVEVASGFGSPFGGVIIP